MWAPQGRLCHPCTRQLKKSPLIFRVKRSFLCAGGGQPAPLCTPLGFAKVQQNLPKKTPQSGSSQREECYIQKNWTAFLILPDPVSISGYVATSAKYESTGLNLGLLWQLLQQFLLYWKGANIPTKASSRPFSSEMFWSFRILENPDL